MSSKQTFPQLAFRYRLVDGPAGVTRETAQRLAKHLGVDETQAIHFALQAYAARVLPQYEADDGPLSDAEIGSIQSRAAAGAKHSKVRSSLFGESGK